MNDATVKFGYDGSALNRGLAQQEGKIKRFASSTESSFRGAQAAIGALGLGILAREGVQVVATFDRMQRGMTTLEGSASGAKQRMEELREASKLPGLEFEQAVQGDIRLRSVGVSAELSKKAIIEMGNALSLAGGTASDLDGVVLALTQIISKGKVSAEEINQIAERVPQVRAVMQDMFGTADTETLQKMNIDAETFVSTLVGGFGKLERAQAGLDEKMSDFTTSIRSAANALLEGLVGQGAEGLSRLGGLLDDNNDKLRETGSLLGNAAGRSAEFFAGFGQGIGAAVGYTKLLADSLVETGGINQFAASVEGINELKKAQAESIDLERQRTQEIKAAGEARKDEIKSLNLPPPASVDPIVAAGEAMNKPPSKEQQQLDERKRKMAEAELPLKEQIAAVEERIAEHQILVQNAAITLNLTEKERIANEMKLLDLMEQQAALKRREEQRQGTPTSTSTSSGAFRPSLPMRGTETRGSFIPPAPEDGYDAQGRRLTDGRMKIRGVQTPDTYTGGPLVTGDRRLSGPFRPLSVGGGHYARQRGAISTSSAAATTATSRGDDLGAKLDRVAELLSKVLLGN